jgi:hypothetical protein
MTTSVRAAAFPVILLAALTACGGGGAGGGTRVVPFFSFLGAAPNETVNMPGVSQTGSGTITGVTVDSFSLNPAVDQANSTMRLTYDGNRNLSGISISTPQSSVSFGPGDIACSSFGACSAANATASAVVMDPTDLGWNYQSFGVWQRNLTATTFQAGALSAGAVTPSVALPTGLTNALFTGRADGFFISDTGALFTTRAEMNAITHFGDREIPFSTTSTFLTDPSTLGLPTPAPGLNLTGLWSYGLGTSQFSGDVDAVNGMTGTASGRFYGPAAEEIGGVYSLTGGGATLLGGFGGKR